MNELLMRPPRLIIPTNNTAHLQHGRVSQVFVFRHSQVLFIELLTGCT